MRCNINFFGEQCDTFCNTSMTHGNCSPNGTRQCDLNYFGENCDVFCHVKAPRGNCSQNGTVQCNINFFGEQCDTFCNASMTHGNCSKNGTRQCDENYFGENCSIVNNISSGHLNCSLKGVSEFDHACFEELCLEFFYSNNVLVCQNIFSEKHCDDMWLHCSNRVLELFSTADDGVYSLNIALNGVFNKRTIPTFFQNLSLILGCSHKKWNYNVSSVVLDARKSTNTTNTIVTFQLVCNNSFITSEHFQKSCNEHRVEINERITPFKILHQSFVQVTDDRQHHGCCGDWLSKYWRLLASVLGVISIALALICSVMAIKMNLHRQILVTPRFSEKYTTEESSVT
uniref:Uncharacterized protein LOC111110646 n=1 Tax=Crassostrea virginica TaxID=6565 RepID=A0A8B8BJ22_CRAVI|nr:uncharacterized protein LOC111110646 [Crassostrea virginica]